MSDEERIAEPLTDAELRSWEATAPFGQVTIGAMELRRILAELRRLRQELADLQKKHDEYLEWVAREHGVGG